MNDAPERHPRTEEPTESLDDGQQAPGRAPRPPLNPPFSHAPTGIAHLPTEILSEILSYLPYFPAGSGPASTRAPAWVSILHVCHWWREVAFACEALWTTVPLGGPEWTEVALERSQPRPLSIRIVSEVEEYDGIEEYLRAAACTTARAVSRAREVVLHAEFENSIPFANQPLFSDALDEMGCKRAPELTSLECKGLSITRSAFFKETPPCLTHLSFYGCSLIMECKLFRAPLTSLSISSSAIFGSIVDVFVVLRRLSTLEDLTLSDVLPIDERRKYEGPVIHLPNLKRIVVHATEDRLTEIIGSLSFPTHAHTSLKCIHMVSATVLDTVEALRVTLAHHFRHVITSPETGAATLRIDIVRTGTLFEATILPDRSSTSTPSSLGNSRISFLSVMLQCGHVTGPPPPQTLRRLLGFVPTLGAFTYLTVALKPSCACTPSDWNDLYALFPSVEKIGITEAAASLLLTLPSAHTPKPLFAGLDTITIARVDFTDSATAPLFECLMESIEERKECEGKGKGLLAALSQCKFTSAMTARLEKYVKVGRVVWD